MSDPISEAVTELLERMRAHEPDEIALRQRVIRLLKPYRKIGRPALPEVTQAVEMRDQGKRWPEIYRRCIPGYTQLDAHQRRDQHILLRARVSARMRCRRRRAKPSTQNGT